MAELIINGTIKNGEAFILLNKKLGTIELQMTPYAQFLDKDLEILRKELTIYQKTENHILKVIGIYGGIVLPKNQTIYVGEDFYRDDFVNIQLNKLLLDTLPTFDIDIKGETYFPSIKGIMEHGLLKIAGESYHSFTTEFYTPILSWLEICLQNQAPRKFRLEFWMTYFNTTSSRRFQHIMEMLARYKKVSEANIEVYWFCEEDDIEMIETANSMLKVTPSLNGNIVIVDSVENNIMNK